MKYVSRIILISFNVAISLACGWYLARAIYNWFEEVPPFIEYPILSAITMTGSNTLDNPVDLEALGMTVILAACVLFAGCVVFLCNIAACRYISKRNH
jgi:Na+/H+ antiporter NhaC